MNIMPKKTKALFMIFKKAVNAERGAQEMYLEALKQTDDPILKKVLQGFYQDEIRHEKELMEQYKILREKYSEQKGINVFFRGGLL